MILDGGNSAAAPAEHGAGLRDVRFGTLDLLAAPTAGSGRLRLHVQKARWDSDRHGTTLQLVWADGDGFTVHESAEKTDD